tara:strand:- start:4656 stop:5561 length:906 start_codon:yes stop_codon:yes gene_type:complete
MIIKNQSNLKVHFAGVEDIYQFGCSHLAGVKYSLYTAFPFICDSIGAKGMLLDGGIKKKIPKIITSKSRHTIQDSGLFTLMFGSHKGKKDEKLIETWYNNLIEFTLENNNGATCVEVDCQKILGVEKAWQLRNRMRLDLPKNRQINVFHKEDGQKGLDRLIEFSDYIAVSIPELRFLGQKNYTEKIVNYIKNKKPEIDIHLLGCTETKLLKKLNFCTSADSTSWKSVLRYGDFEMANGKKMLYRNINEKLVLDNYLHKMKEYIKELNLKPITERGNINYSTLILQAEHLKMKYSYYAGNQE